MGALCRDYIRVYEGSTWQIWRVCYERFRLHTVLLHESGYGEPRIMHGLHNVDPQYNLIINVMHTLHNVHIRGESMYMCRYQVQFVHVDKQGAFTCAGMYMGRNHTAMHMCTQLPLSN